MDTLLALVGPLSVTVALMVLGLLSRQLGRQTHAKPYYVAFFGAAALVGLSIAAQLLDLVFQFPHDTEILWLLLINGLPALGITVGVIFAWRYWSWLLAERN